MRRYHFQARPNYEARLKEIGFDHYSLPSGPDNLPYWQEGVCYIFSEKQIDLIEEATQELHDMSVDMVRSIVQSGDYPDYFGLDNNAKAAIERSWKRADVTLLGRFDLVLSADNQIKMLEYNGDTPVSILEASVAQWDYIQEAADIPDKLRTQFNMIDEHLLDFWKENFNRYDNVHFAQSDSFRSEDFCNLSYILDTAYRSGLNVKDLTIESIGVARKGSELKLVDLENQEIKNIFKLYPWEWLFKSKEASTLLELDVNWLEPAWKALLSNKAMLVKLWKDNPNHPYLLEAYANKPLDRSGVWAKKATHGREGSNLFIYDSNTGVEKLGQGSHLVPEYDEWGYMYQKWHELPVIDGYRPIIGSWVIGGRACGMSVREDKNLITGNDAFFASHIFIPHEHYDQYRNLLDGS